MDELDIEREAMRRMQEAQQKQEEFLDSLVETRIKVSIGGLKASSDHLEIAPDLKIERVSFSEREEFFKRAKNFEKSYEPTERNEFFLINDSIHPRRQMTSPGQRAILVSTFLAIGLEKFLDVTIGQSFAKIQGTFQSTGVYKTPFDSSFYDRNVELSEGDLTLMRALWPSFRDTYMRSSYFRLISRRFYLSRTRTQWEDQLIDLIIAVEAFLTHDLGKSQSGKVKKRLTVLLEKYYKPESVNPILDYCYRTRNMVVHGSDVSSLENDARAMLDQLSLLVRTALQEYVINYAIIDPIEFLKTLDDKTASKG